MIKRIDLFMPTSSLYGAQHHFTKKLYESLVRLGLNCRLLTLDKANPALFLRQLMVDLPDCTIAFNGVRPDPQGRFLCDLIKVPHVACLVDSPLHFMSLTKSHYNIITCIDHFFCKTFQSTGFDRVFFMTLGIENEITVQPNQERKFDILLLASYLDYEKVAQTWKDKYSPAICHALHEAAEMSFAVPTISYVDALLICLKKYAVGEKYFEDLGSGALLDSFEIYLRGLERVRVIKSIINTRIDIFGAGHTKEIWDRHLGKDHNVVIHNGVTYEESIELMKQAKIVLNSCAWIKNGGHDRTFAGMACEAVALTSENPFMNSFYTNNESILYYRGDALNKVDQTITDILKDKSKLQSIAKKGREVTMLYHTWDQRAVSLIKEIEPMIAKMKQNAS